MPLLFKDARQRFDAAAFQVQLGRPQQGNMRTRGDLGEQKDGGNKKDQTKDLWIDQLEVVDWPVDRPLTSTSELLSVGCARGHLPDG